MTLLDLKHPQHQLLRERLAPYIEEATAPATRKAYRVDLRHYQEWGGTLPSTPQQVADYLVHLAQTYKPATLQRRIAAIARAHATLNLTDPTKHELVRLTMRGIRRKLGMAQRQARPLMRDDVATIIATLGDSPRDMRDKCLLLLGFCGAFRRSELVALNVEDVEEVSQGLIVTIRRSKTDAEGVGRRVGIPRAKYSMMCPVQSIALYMASHSLTHGSLFRSLTRQGGFSAHRLSDRSVSNIIKERALAAGLEVKNLSGHSLRAGLATSAAQAGIRPDKIKAQTGHASDAMLNRYIRDGDMWNGNAGGLF